jgi:uncharacterized protein (DUF1330 family)
MAAYLIVDIEVTDPAAFEEYRQKVPASIAKYGGKYLARGGQFEVLEGSWTPKRVVVLEFESMERAKQWYNSPEYRPLKLLRQKSAITNAIFVQGV